MYCDYLEKLEFYKVLEMLSNFCVTKEGKNLAKILTPSNQSIEVQKLLQETRRGC